MKPSFILVGMLGVAACSPSKSAPNNGVDDVKVACEIRAAWTKPNAEKCVNCLAGAGQPACNCELFKEFAGKCHDQNAARLANPGCTPPADCTYKCAKSDCACIDACFAASQECRRLASATDGCVTDVCGAYCK